MGRVDAEIEAREGRHQGVFRDTCRDLPERARRLFETAYRGALRRAEGWT